MMHSGKCLISANSELTVGQLSIGTGSNNVLSLPSLYISLRASKVVTVIGQFRFCQNHSDFSDFPRVLLDAKKQPASFPFSHRFIFSKETSNLPSNPWKLG